MYDLAGGPAIYDDSPSSAASAMRTPPPRTFQVSEASFELPDRILLELPAETAML
jgi:indole-3-acetate monooxygenase